jgi:transposase
MDITDEQWKVLEPLIGELPKRADGRGRPWRSSREVLNGILWILRTGAQWADLPDRCPVGRPTGSVPAVPDVPSTVPTLGPGRDV